MEATNQFAPARSCETAPCQSSLKPERAGVTFIYALRDPRTSAVRYIGKADDVEKRLMGHIYDSRHETNRKANWIKLLLRQGLKPIIEVIDQVAQSEWMPVESAYIIFYKEEGADLLNTTLGGDGWGAGEDHPKFGKRQSPEAIEKMRQTKLGKKLSVEARANMSAAGKRRKPPSDETRAKLSAASAGRKYSVAARANMSAAQRKRKHSPATRAKIGAAQRGKKRSPEAIAKIVAANTGKKRSDAIRAKMRAAWVIRREQNRSLVFHCKPTGKGPLVVTWQQMTLF